MSGAKVVGVISSGPISSQAEVDAAIAMQRPVIEAFYAVPREKRGEVLISLIASWCLGQKDAQDAFSALGEEALDTINKAITQAKATRQ